MARPEALYIKSQFDVGRSKGEEHKQKIKAFFDRVLAKLFK